MFTRTITNPINGATMSFHVINRIAEYDFKNKILRIVVSSFWDKKASDSGLSAMYSATYDCTKDSFKCTSEISPSEEEVFDSLLSLDTFSGALITQ